MIDLTVFLLLRPLWLLALPLVAGLTVLAARRADRGGRWAALIDSDLMVALRRLGHIGDADRDVRPWLTGAAALLMVLGLAGPATRDPSAPTFRNLDVLMILLDLSPSMTEGGSLDDAKAAVARLIDSHGTRPVALSLFAGESFLVSVPTTEPETLLSAVAVIGPDTMPVAGSRPDRALAEAQKTLAEAAAERPDVILVSDGGAVGPKALSTARDLRATGARVSAVYVAPAALPYGAPPASREALVALATQGQGVLVDAGDLGPLTAQLADRHGSTGAEEIGGALLFTDHGPWLMALALLALLPLYRRRREL
jgi:Ca-activated chloride channel homolog